MRITSNFLLSVHFIKEINAGFLLWAKGSKNPRQMDTLMGTFTIHIILSMCPSSSAHLHYLDLACSSTTEKLCDYVFAIAAV